MGELLPIVGGLIAGFAVGSQVRAWRARLAPMTAAAVIVGLLAAWETGELAESAAFLAIDIPGSFLAASVAAVTLDRLRSSRPVGQRRPS